MEIQVINLRNGKNFTFLDQEAINSRYGLEKVTLDTEDFLNDKVLNLYSIGGEGNLFSLPSNKTDGYSENFSQEYIKEGNKYNQRTIELTSSLPAFLIINNKHLYDYVNAVLYQDQTSLLMIIKNGTEKRILNRITCESSPLSDESQVFSFKVWGDAAYSFKSEPKTAKLEPLTTADELHYPKRYPYYFGEDKTKNQIEIDNKSDISVKVNVLFYDGICTNPKLTNVTTGQKTGYNGPLNETDEVFINAQNQTLRKNGTSELRNLIGDFMSLQPGINVLKFTADTFSETTPIKVVAEWQEVYPSV